MARTARGRGVQQHGGGEEEATLGNKVHRAEMAACSACVEGSGGEALLSTQTPERRFCRLPPTQISDVGAAPPCSSRRATNRPTRSCHSHVQIAERTRRRSEEGGLRGHFGLIFQRLETEVLSLDAGAAVHPEAAPNLTHLLSISALPRSGG